MLITVKHNPINKFSFIVADIPKIGNIKTCANTDIEHPTITFVIDSISDIFRDCIRIILFDLIPLYIQEHFSSSE